MQYVSLKQRAEDSCLFAPAKQYDWHMIDIDIGPQIKLALGLWVNNS